MITPMSAACAAGEDVTLRSLVQQVVTHHRRVEMAVGGGAAQRGVRGVFGVALGDADEADLSRGLFVQENRKVPRDDLVIVLGQQSVDLHDVDDVHPQAVKRTIDGTPDVGGSDDALVGGVAIFGGDQVGIARHAVERLAEQHLTLVVDLGGVEQVDAVVERAPDETPGRRSRGAAPLPEQARAAGALRHQRHLKSGTTEPSIFHVPDSAYADRCSLRPAHGA